jgi:glycosyl hydrolase family 99
MSHHLRAFTRMWVYLGLGAVLVAAAFWAQWVPEQRTDWVYGEPPVLASLLRPGAPAPAGRPVTPSLEAIPGTLTRMVLPTVLPERDVPTVVPPGDDLILAHYMAWFQTPAVSGKWAHWVWDPDEDGGQDAQDHIPSRMNEQGEPDLASAHRPWIGAYDSSDPAVIEYHLASAWAAGIDGFVVDWYGPQNDIDRALDQVFEIVDAWRALYGFRFFLAITYEEQILQPFGGAMEREAMASAHLRYALDRYAARDAYLRVDGAPVIFYFEQWVEGIPGLLRPDQLARVRDSLPELYLLYMGAEEEFLGTSEGFFSWVSGANRDPADWGQAYVNWVYGEMDRRAEKHGHKLNVGSVWPGFDDSLVWGWGDVPRYIDRQDGLIYAQTWESALRDQAERKRESVSWVQIVTWNDWNEGTEIEPSQEYGYDYLEATQRYAARYTGRKMPLLALRIAETIFLARRAQPGQNTEAMIDRVYRHFFAGQFESAWDLLRAAGFAGEEHER